MQGQDDPAVVGQWITETQAKKLAADVRLRAVSSAEAMPQRMTKEEITATVNTIAGLMSALSSATAADKAEIYAGLGLRLTYNPGLRTVITRAEISQTCTKGSCPRGDLNSRAATGISIHRHTWKGVLTSQNGIRPSVSPTPAGTRIHRHQYHDRYHGGGPGERLAAGLVVPAAVRTGNHRGCRGGRVHQL
jgi:hypothetical protein